MAVAAYNGAVYLYALKSMETLREELREGLSLKPIKEVRRRITWIVIDTANIDDLIGKTYPGRGFHIENGISPFAPQ
jgi:hypothetical protein